MKEYLDLMKKVLDTGVDRPDRTGTGTRALFAEQLRFNLQEGFPAVTTKKLAWNAVKSELLWFLEGSGDEKRLKEILHGSRESTKPTIWTGNAEAPYWQPKAEYEGDLGRVYGVQWRDWTNSDGKKVDQLLDLVDGLKKDPYGRRHVLSAWNPGELDQMALPPCHMFAQFFVAPMTEVEMNIAYLAKRATLPLEDRAAFDIDATGMSREGRPKTAFDLLEIGIPSMKLSCQMYQRSADLFLGVPFNIASYALLTHMLAQVSGYSAGELILTFGDAHVYHNHFEAARTQLERSPYTRCVLKINKDVTDMTKFCMSDLNLENYSNHPTIKAPMAV